MKFLSLAFLCLAASSHAADPAAWAPLFHGIDLREWTLTQPRPLRGYTVRIDLEADGIRSFTTPDNGPAEGETNASKTSTFLRENKLQLAINAAPFSPIADKEGQPQDVVGLAIHDGKVVSPGKNGAPALLLFPDGARVTGDSSETTGCVSAVGGFSIVLRDGAVVPHPKDPLHPRTAAGVSKDQRWLYLLVVDGRQPGYSEGATCEELGQWLREAGAWDGINLDGGGSTALVKEDGPGKSRVINRPIHGFIPHRERIVGSHLGFFARPLADEPPSADKTENTD